MLPAEGWIMSSGGPNIQDSVGISISQSEFVGDVEKHLDDYRKGKGNLSKNTAYELNQRDDAVSIQLSQINVRALKLYSGYSTGFSYDKKARFVEGTSYAVNQMARYLNARKDLEK
jgi:hypothetical protein